MKKQVSIFVLIISILLAILFTFEITFLIVNGVNKRERAELAEDYQNKLDEYKQQLDKEYDNISVFKTIAEIYNAMPENERNSEIYHKLAMIDYYYRTNYANQIDEEKLMYYVLNGYIAGTGDKYGEYYTADDFELLMQESEGNTVGIGVYVNYSEEYDAIKILSVMKDSPAHKAGLMAGDVITYIDGKSVSELTYYIALDTIRGAEGSTVKLTAMRKGEALEFDVVRAKVTTESVTYHKYELDNTVGIVRIIDFNDTTPTQFKAAISNLMNEGVTSLVFDVRNNPGGTLTSVVDILDFLLPEGDIVHVTDADGNILRKHTSNAEHLTGIKSMAVLTNENTASAAELFTQALKDYGLAKSVGTKTYGKGSVQTVLMLPDGTGLRFTTSKYKTAKTDNFDGIGINPDILVELSDALKDKNQFEYTDTEDNQLKSAYDNIINKQN